MDVIYKNLIDDSATVLASIIGGVATFASAGVIYFLTKRYSEHTKKIEQDKLFKDLFTEFNVRYDKINSKIDDISKISMKEWHSLKLKKREKLIHTIYDYFNLCAEEYYWKKENRIPEKVWKSWSKGMNVIYNRSEVIQMIWNEECKENEGVTSYYIENKNEFFK
jgi:hypothetical protein